MSSCATAKDAFKITPHTNVGVQWRDAEIGPIGGGGDSIALWLAITGLVATPVLGALLYQYGLRPRRIKREKGRNTEQEN